MQTIRSSQKIGQLGGKEALNLERRNAQLECREALNCWLLSLGCVCRSLDMESDRWRKLDEQVQLQSKTFSADEYFAKWWYATKICLTQWQGQNCPSCFSPWMLLGVLQDHHNLVLANALKVASGDSRRWCLLDTGHRLYMGDQYQLNIYNSYDQTTPWIQNFASNFFWCAYEPTPPKMHCITLCKWSWLTLVTD